MTSAGTSISQDEPVVNPAPALPISSPSLRDLVECNLARSTLPAPARRSRIMSLASACRVSVFVAVVDVRVVRMAVADRLVAVRVAVGLAGRVAGEVLVLVVLVVAVQVIVLHRLVFVLVFVALGQVQPHADAHQD